MFDEFEGRQPDGRAFGDVSEEELNDPPAWIREETPQWVLEANAREHAAFLVLMDPFERFEYETGLPATIENGYVPPIVSEEIAVGFQERLADVDRVARMADARRLLALLDAYDASMADLAQRFGAEVASRAGMGAQAFFRTAGLSLQQHPMQVAHLVDTASTAKRWLPFTWAVFLRGDTTWRAIDLAVRQAEGLDPERWPDYDAEAARLVVTSTRLKDALRRVRERLQDDTAPKRAKQTFQRRATHLDGGAGGAATWSMTGPAADLVAFDDALGTAAVAAHGVEGEDRSVTQLKYDIALDLLAGGLTTAATVPEPAKDKDKDGAVTGPAATFSPLVPARKAVEVKLILIVPALSLLGHSSEQAQLEGHGPIDLDTATRLAGEAKSFVRVLTDPHTGVRLAMDRATRTPPADLARWVQVRDQHCRFPGCRRAAHLCDLDHAREWHDGGVTDAINLISLCRTHHNPKTAGLYREHLTDEGAVDWIDPWGNHTSDPPADPMDPAPAHLLRPDEDDEDNDSTPF